MKAFFNKDKNEVTLTSENSAEQDYIERLAHSRIIACTGSSWGQNKSSIDLKLSGVDHYEMRTALGVLRHQSREMMNMLDSMGLTDHVSKEKKAGFKD